MIALLRCVMSCRAVTLKGGECSFWLFIDYVAAEHDLPSNLCLLFATTCPCWLEGAVVSMQICALAPWESDSAARKSPAPPALIPLWICNLSQLYLLKNTESQPPTETKFSRRKILIIFVIIYINSTFGHCISLGVEGKNLTENKVPLKPVLYRMIENYS